MEYQPPVGYVLKEAQSLLRLRMEEALAPLQLTVSQYSCLHRLSRDPGASAATLARGTFVTRQSMNSMLQLLLERGLVQRPGTVDNGRALPTTITTEGAELLDAAQARVDEVEQRMLSGLGQPDQVALLRTLTACVEALQ
jgi:DNA-binding MarR family transcriptional regulator